MTALGLNHVSHIVVSSAVSNTNNSKCRPIIILTKNDRSQRKKIYICALKTALESLQAYWPLQAIQQPDCILCSIFTVRRYAQYGLSYRNSVHPSVRLSVRLSICPSVCHTRALCPHGSTYDHDFFTIWQPHHSSFWGYTFIPKFEGGHPERGR